MIELANISTRAPEQFTKQETKRETQQMAKQIGDLLRILVANKKENLLVVLQGMDASGKDGATRETFKFCSPTGVSAVSYKKPTDVEFAHDFLWRIHKNTPRKGQIMVFNRSHYEEVLIQRVHKWVTMDRVEKRMEFINNFEALLEAENDTIVLKFYLHLSYEKQGEKLQERIDDPRKNYKHNPGDWEERKLWAQYREAYEYAINNSDIPWTIIPADQRWYRNYCVAKKVLEVLQGLNLTYPTIQVN